MAAFAGLVLRAKQKGIAMSAPAQFEHPELTAQDFAQFEIEEIATRDVAGLIGLTPFGASGGTSTTTCCSSSTCSSTCG